jgi:hypothetical protein
MHRCVISTMFGSFDCFAWTTTKHLVEIRLVAKGKVVGIVVASSNPNWAPSSHAL